MRIDLYITHYWANLHLVSTKPWRSLWCLHTTVYQYKHRAMFVGLCVQLDLASKGATHIWTTRRLATRSWFDIRLSVQHDGSSVQPFFHLLNTLPSLVLSISAFHSFSFSIIAHKSFVATSSGTIDYVLMCSCAFNNLQQPNIDSSNTHSNKTRT